MLHSVLAAAARRAGLRYSAPPPTLSEYRAKPPSETRKQGGRRIGGVGPQGTPEQPLVSIITAVRNNPDTLQSAIDSIKAQTYPNIEHIVIDGASTDNTLDVIRANEDHIALWISEPDQGIYDAFNKGVALAQGTYIGILNADDYYSPEQLKHAVETLTETGADWTFGDIILHGWKGSSVRVGADPLYAHSIRKTMPSIHQVNALAHRRLFETRGLFRTDYRIASDYDWFLRITLHGAVGRYDDRILAHMRSGGVSTTQQRRAIIEGYFVAVRNGYPLIGATRHWSLRWLYPNGAPQRVQDWIARARRIKWRIMPPPAQPALIAPVGEPSPSAPSALDLSTLQSAFVEARHLGSDLNEDTLLALASLGQNHASFAVLGDSTAVLQAATMLGAACENSSSDLEEADLVVTPISELTRIGDRIKGKTVLVLVPAKAKVYLN